MNIKEHIATIVSEFGETGPKNKIKGVSLVMELLAELSEDDVVIPSDSMDALSHDHRKLALMGYATILMQLLQNDAAQRKTNT